MIEGRIDADRCQMGCRGELPAGRTGPPPTRPVSRGRDRHRGDGETIGHRSDDRPFFMDRGHGAVGLYDGNDLVDRRNLVGANLHHDGKCLAGLDFFCDRKARHLRERKARADPRANSAASDSVRRFVEVITVLVLVHTFGLRLGCARAADPWAHGSRVGPDLVAAWRFSYTLQGMF